MAENQVPPLKEFIDEIGKQADFLTFWSSDPGKAKKLMAENYKEVKCTKHVCKVDLRGSFHQLVFDTDNGVKLVFYNTDGSNL